MLPKSPLIVQDLNNLHLDIHTIGYPNEGETLLTLLCDGNEVLFSVLTDCYEDNGYNHATQILKEFNVNQIDAFIWTHPDKDHSLGIPDFLDKYDPQKKAEIFLPHLNRKMGLKQKALGALNYVKKHYNKNRKYDAIFVELHKGDVKPEMRLIIEVMNPRVTIKCSHNFLLPNDNVVDRILDSDTKPLLNDLSIVYFIKFNGISFFFCGDLSERNVQFIDPVFFKNSVFIKIPHHGSDNESDDLNKRLVPLFRSQDVKHAISTTTVFKCQNLPKDEVLKEYCTISDGVYCTSNINEQSSEPYGCITVKFYANMQKPEVITSGNAYCYYHV